MIKARVLKSTGSWYQLENEHGEIITARLRGKFKMEGFKVTNPIAVGDWVKYLPEDGQDGYATITEIEPRKNYIIRQSTHKKNHFHLLAANIDQAFLIVTLELPKTSLGFIDRFLVAAEYFRIPVHLVFNKSDLWDDYVNEWYEQLKGVYEPIGYVCSRVSARKKEGLSSVIEAIKGKVTMLSGHSGVGKSSLMNAISPTLDLKTKHLNEHERGQHTTTFAEMHAMNELEAYIVDTPGINEFGLADLEDGELKDYFPEMRAQLGNCRFHNCQHLNEPGCVIKTALDESDFSIIDPERYLSYLSMLENEDNRR